MACMFCGDDVDENICYSCEDTANEMGFDAEELGLLL